MQLSFSIRDSGSIPDANTISQFLPTQTRAASLSLTFCPLWYSIQFRQFIYFCHERGVSNALMKRWKNEAFNAEFGARAVFFLIFFTRARHTPRHAISENRYWICTLTVFTSIYLSSMLVDTDGYSSNLWVAQCWAVNCWVVLMCWQ